VVTPTPHEGCQKFRARFGTAALRLVSGKALRNRNLRGVYMRVLQDGDVAVGDTVTVLDRSGAAAGA
jgi:MOSC domain-containing protein YiiM